SGYTDTNKLVNFTGNNLKRGDIVKVYIDVVKTWSLNGKQI
ncbi:MAG: TRAM domain-containing protein, partial [Erysipelotrichaceae bacterium]